MDNKCKNILVFGTGDYYQRYKSWLEEYNILALLDNSARKQGTTLDDCPIVSPKEGIKLEYEFIIILSIYDREIREQLLTLGVNNDLIYNQNDLHLLLTPGVMRPLSIYIGNNSELNNYEAYSYDASGKIVLFSNDLHINGASLALINAAEVLSKKHDVVVVTSEDGPCREILTGKKIDVIIDNNIAIVSMAQIPWLAVAKLIVCNTIHFYRFLIERHIEVPVIWWLHEPAFFYEGIERNALMSVPQENMTVLAVSTIAKQPYLSYHPNVSVNILPVYVDKSCKQHKQEHEKFTFATIGYIRPWKGQDIFIDAAQKILQVYNDVNFLVVGDDSSPFAQELKKAESDKIHFTGERNPEQLNDMYNDIDIIVCPSRIESLSIVVIEGMFREIPSIVSSSAGISEYITDGFDGWIFKSENIDELINKMVFAIENKKTVSNVGRNSKVIYENNFTKKVFSERLLRIVEESTVNSV